jgi:Cu+-exporting ATPase
MNATESTAKDPVCGMTVDKSTAIHADRDGETFYFCGEHCREKFLADPTDTKAEGKSGSCCG